MDDELALMWGDDYLNVGPEINKFVYTELESIVKLWKGMKSIRN